MPNYCSYYLCENELPELHYRVLRVIKTGNKRRTWPFCSIACIINFFDREK